MDATKRFFLLLKACSLLLVSTLSACSSSKDLPPIHVFSFVDQAHVGDSNQIKGVIAALQQHAEQPVVLHDQLDDVKTCDKPLVLIAGSAGLKHSLTMLLPSQAKRCFLTHQAPTDLQQLVGAIDSLALPTHAVTDELKAWAARNSIVLVPTVGVAHNTSLQTITDAYQAVPALVGVPQPYLGVILGGDAPEADGSMRFYTIAEAQVFAATIARLASQRGASVLVLNGPRTGKFDPVIGKEYVGVHRNGMQDCVTQAFMQVLDAHGLRAGEHVQLFDFQFGQPSFFHAVLGAIKATNGVIVVNGESTSMVAECTSVLAPTQIVLVRNGAMNHIHRKHVDQEFAVGRAALLKADGSIIFAPKQAIGYSAADQIALSILVMFKS